jgi:transcriptional regulator with XRE-family HTH domain
MDVKTVIGLRIKELRRAKGYSQERLAEIVGINPKYLSSIERGEENPTLDLFIRLSQGLKVGIDEIFAIRHHGENPTVLRKKIKTLFDNVADENLVRIIRLLEAIVH